jgi:hypothetical protein
LFRLKTCCIAGVPAIFQFMRHLDITVLLAEHHGEFILCHHLNWENITNGKYMVILGLCQKDGFDIRDHKKNIKLRKPCPLTSILSDLGKDYHCSMQWWSNWVQYVYTKFLPGHSLGTSYYLSRENNLEFLK